MWACCVGLWINAALVQDVANQRKMCQHCEVPLCKDCATVVEQPWGIFDGLYPQPPPRALSNDLMIFYAPKSIYEDQMTVLEMICSSVCITSMICFSMEVKYGHLLDTRVHMQDTIVAARGNATSFLMPWQSVLAELRRLERKEKTMRQLICISRARISDPSCKYF